MYDNYQGRDNPVIRVGTSFTESRGYRFWSGGVRARTSMILGQVATSYEYAPGSSSILSRIIACGW
jgi:hypothetical protein